MRDKAAQWAAANIEAARLILAESDRYGGENSGLVKWAKRTIEAARSDSERAASFETLDNGNV
jgi:hypothetical protein